MRTEAAKARDARWQKANVTKIQIKFYKNTDAEMISFLESLDNKQGYIKQLIREDMKKKGE